MIVYRIAVEAYKDDISGNGASIYGARWNSVGTRMLYTSSHISLAILESLVHLPERKFPPDLHLIKIDIAHALESSQVTVDKVKREWKQQLDYTRWIGDQFIRNKEALLLKVPSAVVPEEQNILINPLHKDFRKIKIVSAEVLDIDERLQLNTTR
jgi:RES domain-containing protein